MKRRYKRHTILITCWPTLDPIGFAPEIRIRNSDLALLKVFKFAQRFHTEAEAERYALLVGKKWIDEDRPEAKLIEETQS
jgi:hypothetical protein